MAMSPIQVGSEVAATLASMNKALTASTKKGLGEVGKAAKKELEASGRTRVRSLRFRNMKGARLGVRYKVGAAEVSVSPTGPWGILEPGAKAHTIVAKKGRRSNAMRVNGGWRRGPFRHPGTSDTRAWTTGQEATFDAAEKILTDTIGDAVEGAFGG